MVSGDPTHSNMMSTTVSPSPFDLQWKAAGIIDPLITVSTVATLTGHSDTVYGVAVLADGRLVSGSWDNTVKVWTERSDGSGDWDTTATLTGHSNYVRCVAVLADGRLVSGSRDNTVKVWG